MPTPSLPMQFGVPLDQMSPLFFGCLGIAIWLVYISARQRFGEPSVTGSSDYIYQLLPRHLATREEYSKGFLTYFGTLAVIVVLLSLLGPKNLGALGITVPDAVGYIVVPLFIAFVLNGALPTVPGLTNLEKHLRAYAHKRAYIPDSARATADRLAFADFDFSSYRTEDILQSPEMRGVDPADFNRPRRCLRHSWARLCCLISVEKSGIEGPIASLDASLLRDYKEDLDLIESQKKAMETEVATYRIAKASDPYYTNEKLHREICDNLYKLYILLGCAVRLKMQPHDVDLALQRLGFKLNQATRAPSTGDLQLVGLTAVAASITLIGLVAWSLGTLGLWTMSPVYPQKVFQPFVDTASTLIPHAVAILLADLLRKRAISKGTWFSASGSKRRANIANHIRVAAACGVAGYVGLILWGLALVEPTVKGFIIDAPNSLLAMVTGGFYVYHLDNAELGHRPSRLWELGSQAVLTGLCGLISACATWDLILGSAGAAIDKIVLTTAINAFIGFAFAWYFPQAAGASRHDPLAEAGSERVGALEAAARVRLDDNDAAIWLDKPHPALNNRSPRAAAAASVDGFYDATGLLQGPRALAA